MADQFDEVAIANVAALEESVAEVLAGRSADTMDNAGHGFTTIYVCSSFEVCGMHRLELDLRQDPRDTCI